MRKTLLLGTAALFTLGCSKSSWFAGIYMYRAEKAYDNAHALRIEKDRDEERLKYYREACGYFSKAHESDRSVFTLNRIYMALDSCTRVGDSEKEGRFKEFEEAYVREHPKEVEYGDAGFMIGLE